MPGSLEMLIFPISISLCMLFIFGTLSRLSAPDDLLFGSFRSSTRRFYSRSDVGSLERSRASIFILVHGHGIWRISDPSSGIARSRVPGTRRAGSRHLR